MLKVSELTQLMSTVSKVGPIRFDPAQIVPQSVWPQLEDGHYAVIKPHHGVEVDLPGQQIGDLFFMRQPDGI